jgi:hypothetical protein
LKYDPGLLAVANDPAFDEPWKEWVLMVRRQVGLVDLCDMIYVRSQYYHNRRVRSGHADQPEAPVLFGEKEGRISLANRGRDPVLLFAALHRQLGYPAVPKPKPVDETRDVVPLLARRVERLESRLKLVEEEAKGGIDIERFYGGPDKPTG